MINSKVFRKHFLLSTGILLVFMFLGYAMTQAFINSVQERFGPTPAVFFAKMIDSYPVEQRAETAAKIQLSAEKTLPRKFQLVDENGELLYPKSSKLAFNWADMKKPDLEYTKTSIGSRDNGDRIGYDIVRLSGLPKQYLVLTFSVPPKDEAWVYISCMAILISSLAFGVGVALFLIFRSMKQTVELADSVISELQRGNLKVRFPVTKLDEIGRVMSRFNKMADEIEHLVEQLRSVEQTRIKLLQELAHDLRTPVASLKNLTETVHIKGDSLNSQLRGELLALSLKEIDYFEQLVEDLLVLAQMSEPRYHLNQISTSIAELVEEESMSAKRKQGEKNLRIEIDNSLKNKNFEVLGDPHLLRRLLRNSLENACSFAQSEVRIKLRQDLSQQIEIVIEDDGPGFSSEVLKSFGERRVSRVLGTHSHSGRLSVGLGSVIMKAIVEVHRGALAVSNRSDGERGARVVLKLPTEAGA